MVPACPIIQPSPGRSVSEQGSVIRAVTVRSSSNKTLDAFSPWTTSNLLYQLDKKHKRSEALIRRTWPRCRRGESWGGKQTPLALRAPGGGFSPFPSFPAVLGQPSQQQVVTPCSREREIKAFREQVQTQSWAMVTGPSLELSASAYRWHLEPFSSAYDALYTFIYYILLFIIYFYLLSTLITNQHHTQHLHHHLQPVLTTVIAILPGTLSGFQYFTSSLPHLQHSYSLHCSLWNQRIYWYYFHSPVKL